MAVVGGKKKDGSGGDWWILALGTKLKGMFCRENSLRDWCVFIPQHAVVYKVGLHIRISIRSGFQQLSYPSFLIHTMTAGLYELCCGIRYNIYSLPYLLTGKCQSEVPAAHGLSKQRRWLSVDGQGRGRTMLNRRTHSLLQELGELTRCSM
jgi:hypothetical protein